MHSISSSKDRAKTDEARLRQAASLFRYVEGWWQDRCYTKDGGRLFYAVDVDVVTMQIAPAENAEYANVFDQEDLETAQLLARLIGDFIFSRLDSIDRVPLFLLPPHDEELFRMGNAISNRLLDHIAKGAGELLASQDSLFEEFDRDQNYDKLLRMLCERAPHLVRLFDTQRGPGSELIRLVDLFERQTLQNIERYFDPTSKWAFPVPNIEEHEEDARSFGDLKASWLHWLNESKPAKKPRYAIEGDAEALARLEWINQRLKAEKRRLVLITGSNYIFAAAARHDRNKDFSLWYLRHPRAFLADDRFFLKSSLPSNSRKADFKLLDWLNLFFPNIIRSEYLSQTGEHLINQNALVALLNPQNHDFLSTLVTFRRAEAARPLEEYVNEWGEQVDATAVARNIAPELFKTYPAGAKQALEFTLKHRSSAAIDETAFVKALYKVSLLSLNRLYSSAAWIGLWAQEGEQSEYIKGIPYLNFDMDPEAQAYCDGVFERLRKSRPDINLVEMYKTLSAIDDVNYLAHTVHALAYATKGHWHAAKTLCRVAMAVSDDLPLEKRGSRKGREAAYLAAVSTRRIMVDVNDLDYASDLLEEAIRRDDDGRQDLRFQSEKWAIVTAKHHLIYFQRAEIPNVPTLDETITGLRSVIDSRLSDKNEDCRNWVQRQALTNLFNVLFIATRENTAPPESIDLLREYLGMFDEVTASTAEDRLARVTFEMAYALWGSDLHRRKTYARNVTVHTLPITLSFDKMRQETMRRAARAVYEELK